MLTAFWYNVWQEIFEIIITVKIDEAVSLPYSLFISQ